jgi:hypothetical protein
MAGQQLQEKPSVSSSPGNYQLGSGLHVGQTATAGETDGQPAQVTISLDLDFMSARQRLQEKRTASQPR